MDTGVLSRERPALSGWPVHRGRSDTYTVVVNHVVHGSLDHTLNPELVRASSFSRSELLNSEKKPK